MADRRKATTDDARKGAYFTDGAVLYEVYGRREVVPTKKPYGKLAEECLLGDAMAEAGGEVAAWVPVDEVEGLELVREGSRPDRTGEGKLLAALAGGDRPRR